MSKVQCPKSAGVVWMVQLAIVSVKLQLLQNRHWTLDFRHWTLLHKLRRRQPLAAVNYQYRTIDKARRV